MWVPDQESKREKQVAEATKLRDKAKSQKNNAAALEALLDARLARLQEAETVESKTTAADITEHEHQNLAQKVNAEEQKSPSNQQAHDVYHTETDTKNMDASPVLSREPSTSPVLTKTTGTDTQKTLNVGASPVSTSDTSIPKAGEKSLNKLPSNVKIYSVPEQSPRKIEEKQASTTNDGTNDASKQTPPELVMKKDETASKNDENTKQKQEARTSNEGAQQSKAEAEETDSSDRIEAALVSTSQGKKGIDDLEGLILKKTEELVELHRQHNAALEEMKHEDHHQHSKETAEGRHSLPLHQGSSKIVVDDGKERQLTDVTHEKKQAKKQAAILAWPQASKHSETQPAERPKEDTAVLQKDSKAKATRAMKDQTADKVPDNPEYTEFMKQNYPELHEEMQAKMETEYKNTESDIDNINSAIEELEDHQNNVQQGAAQADEQLHILADFEVDGAKEVPAQLKVVDDKIFKSHEKVVNDAQVLYENTRKKLIDASSQLNDQLTKGIELVKKIDSPVEEAEATGDNIPESDK